MMQQLISLSQQSMYYPKHICDLIKIVEEIEEVEDHEEEHDSQVRFSYLLTISLPFNVCLSFHLGLYTFSLEISLKYF